MSTTRAESSGRRCSTPTLASTRPGTGPAPLRLALDRAEAASGAERADRFGALERRILRTSVPWVTYEQLAAPVFTSARLGCVVASPVYSGVDLAALCLNS